MDRIQFDSLTIEKQINYINTQLQQGKSLNNILKDIGIPKTTFRDRAKRHGYELDKIQRQYVLVTKNQEQQESNQEVIEEFKIPYIEKIHAQVINENGEIMCKDITITNDINLVINTFKNELISMREQLDELYSWYNRQRNVIEKEELKINKFKGEAENRTYKIYPEVLKAFNKFCKEHRQYKVQDLISQALWEFIKKYE